MKKKVAAIYARVSTSNQSTELQYRELIAYVRKRGWSPKLYQDAASGATHDRPGLANLIADCCEREIQVVVIWSLDRLGRSLKHLLEIVDQFRENDIDLVVLKQSLDTTTPAGRLTFQVLGAVAEFEREMLRERVRSGIANAKKKGKRFGRPPLVRFSEQERVDIRSAHANGKSIRKLASELGTTQWMVAQIVADRY